MWSHLWCGPRPSHTGRGQKWQSWAILETLRPVRFWRSRLYREDSSRYKAVHFRTISDNIGQFQTISDNIGQYRQISATRCFRQISADIGKNRQPLGTLVIRDWKVSRVKPGKALPDETQIELRPEMEMFMNGRNRSDRRGGRDRGHLEETSAEESTRRGKQIVNRILTAKSSKLGGELRPNC